MAKHHMVWVLLGVEKPLARCAFTQAQLEESKGLLIQSFVGLGLILFLNLVLFFYPFGDYVRMFDVFWHIDLLVSFLQKKISIQNSENKLLLPSYSILIIHELDKIMEILKKIGNI